jgi:AcrR family transcriptional regulator
MKEGITNMVREQNPDKRTRYMQSALKLFVERGVEGTSTAAIAKDAGTAAGTLFIYFPTKQDLIHELVLEIAQDQSEYIHSLLHSSFNAEETFKTIWEGSINWFLNNLDAYHYIRQVRDPGLIAEEIVRESEQYLVYYYEAIQKGLDEGTIKPYPQELIGTFLYQGIAAVMNLITSGNEAHQRSSYIQQGFDIFWDGIKAG